MRDLDETIRRELSTHLDNQPSLDAAAFHDRLTERRRKRAVVRGAAISGLSLLVVLAIMAPLSLDLTDGSRPEPSRRPPRNADAIAVPGRLAALAVGPDTRRVWVLNQRGEIAHLDGERLRFLDSGPQRSPSGWRALSVASDQSLWVANGRRVQHVDRSGKLVAATRIGSYVDELEVGSGYVWALDGGSGVTRVDPETLEQRTVAISRSDDIETLVTDDLAVGFGAAWVAGGETGEVLRIDASSLDITRIPIGRAEDADREEFAAGGYAAQVMTADDEVWVCCDDEADLVALNPASGEVKARIDLQGDDEPGGDTQLAFGDERVWVTGFGRYGDQSFQALFSVDPDSYEIDGPFPLPTGADDLVATPGGLLIDGFTEDRSEQPILYRLAYADLADLPFPSEPEESKAVLWLILGGIIALLGLVVFLGRDANEDEEQ